MRVIFIQDIHGVAKRNSIREVADGFALNYLLPRGLAVRATPEKEQALSQQQMILTQKEEKFQKKAVQLASRINGQTVVISRPAASTGTLYASITPQMLSQALSEQHQILLDPEQIIVPAHIKKIGLHQVKIHLTDKIEAVLNLQINKS